LAHKFPKCGVVRTIQYALKTIGSLGPYQLYSAANRSISLAFGMWVHYGYAEVAALSNL